MNTQQEMTEATLAAIAKASTNGITTATGLYSYDLGPLVQLVPVVTPARDMIPRVVAADGNPYAVWRAILNNTSAQPSPFMGLDFAANVSKVAEQDFQAKYMRSGMGGTVTLDAQDFSKGYSDANAVATFQTLNQVMIGDDRALVGAQSFPLAQPTAPTLTQHTTGGTIAASTTVYVGVAGRTGTGYYYGTGNSRGASASGASGSGTATNTVSATISALRGAVAYDWFQSANGTTWYYYTTTTVNSVTMNKVIGADQAMPSGVAVPDLSANWKGTANAVPTYNGATDNGSGDPNQYDGLLATLSGDYSSTGQWVQSGTANANPATFSSLDGAALTLGGGSVNEFNQYLFLPLWNQVKCSPTALMMNASQAQETATLILGSTGATTFLNTDANGRLNVTAGGRVGSVINAPAGGIEVPIEVHPSVPPGTIIARTDRVPFPQANISNVLEYRALRDTYRYDYASSRLPGQAGGGPRVDFEIESLGAFVNRAPVSMAVLSNVG
jgi:hypothetical protein